MNLKYTSQFFTRTKFSILRKNTIYYSFVIIWKMITIDTYFFL